MSLSQKAQFAIEFIDLEEASGVKGAVWETFQIDYLNTKSPFAVWTKSRQIAWSWTSALDAVIDSIFEPGTPHIFISVTQEEAKEKIRYAKDILRAMDSPTRPILARPASMTSLEFKNGSRLISYPCRPPRGFPRARLYLDEMAHYKRGLDHDIFLGAIPATTKGGGYLRIGSSPAGASGIFHSILSDDSSYPDFERRVLPWWTVRALCDSPNKAIKLAPFMTTHDRVQQFGTDVIRRIFANMFLEDFQQEYECSWTSDKTAWIGWSDIENIQDHTLVFHEASTVDEALGIIDDVLASIRKGEIEPALLLGGDCGRKNDMTSIVLIGKTSTRNRPLRCMIKLRNVAWRQQETVFLEIVRRLPIIGGLIDATGGYGGQIVEKIEEESGDTIKGFIFTNPSKELLAVEVRKASQNRHLAIPPHRELASHIHSIKRIISPAGNVRYDSKRNDAHHADLFWAMALALWAGKEDYIMDYEPIIIARATPYDNLQSPI